MTRNNTQNDTLAQIKDEATEVVREGEYGLNLKFRPAPDRDIDKMKNEIMNVEKVAYIMESLSKENGVLQYQIIIHLSKEE
jgi:hypothetical protein